MVKIFCPLCEWRPRPFDRWYCLPGCGTSWNTFATHGVCPHCGFQWSSTQCLACHKWSPHDEWYHEEVPEEVAVTEEAAAELVGV